MVTFTMASNAEIEIARSVGIGDLSFFSRIHQGGGAACAVVHQAAMAIETGAAEVVVCYRALNGRSWRRFGAGVHNRPPVPTAEGVRFGWYTPLGLLPPAQWGAMFAPRYIHRYGAPSAAFGRGAGAHPRH